MKPTWLKKMLRVIVFLLVLPLVIIFWLIGTESGLNFFYQNTKSYIPGSITIGMLQGNLVGSISANDLQYKHNGTLIHIARLKMDWLPAGLFTNSLNINQLHLQSVKITLPADDNNKPGHPVILPEIDFPWRIVLKNIVIEDFNLNQAGTNFDLKKIKLDASTLFNQVKVKSLVFISEYAELNLKGQLNLNQNFKHKFEMNWWVKLPANTTIESKGSIEGNIKSLKIFQSVRGPVQLTFKAEVHDLLDKLNWQAKADIINITPDKIWPEWPAKINGQLTSNGVTKKGQLFANVDISKLKGQLRGLPVSLKSHLQWQDDNLELSRFDLSSGKTQFSAQGKILSDLNLNWTLISHNLADLYPQAKGQLNASGQLIGSISAPELNTTFNAHNLALPNYKIASLKGNIGLDLFHWQKIKIKLAAQSLKLKEYELQSLEVTADNQKTEIKLHSNMATALVKLESEIQPHDLQIRIVKADLISPQFTAWKLKSPASLKIADDQILLEPLCLLSTEGKLCATLQRQNGIWQSHIEINKLPLMVLSPWLPLDLKLEGVTDATADFTLSSKLQGQSRITLLPGTVSYPLLRGEREQLKYRKGSINVTLNEQGLETSVELDINNNDTFKGHLLLPYATLPGLDSDKQALKATLQLNIHNHGLLETFIPEVQDLKGEAGLNFVVSGTLAQPKLKGSAQLDNASLRIPRLGLSIKELTMNSNSDSFNNLNFKLSARSGEGQIKINGQTKLDHASGWPTSVTLTGENFEVAHIPVSHLLVSPNLQFNLQKHTIKITGKVDIPYAKLYPKDITTAERISNDVVIIGSEKTKEEEWLIHTKVRLLLGDQVHLSGFGFDGRLTGNLLLEDEPNQPTKANGEIKIPEGRYAAYGQNLQIENGKLLFTGGPVTNPGLDIRALRQIDTVTAGLKVRGSLNQPKIELFAIPAMGQTDTLSYLILGRPIEKATGNEGEMMAKAALTLSLIGGDRLARTLGERFGLDEMRVESSNSGNQASLVIGRYLSPKLYVGYGVGLIESFNTFNVRYKITDKWQLKGESGENQGADILYTIER